MNRLIGTMQFLTRITINKELPFDEDFQKGIVYFPIIGLILGAILVSFYYLLSFVFPTSLVALLTVVLHIILTGGLHLDGLGDTFDGLYSNRSKERILEIMKDSRLGTNALLAIIVVVAIKVVGLQNLQSYQVYMALLLMPVMGRQALVLACYNVPYARKEGMGNIYIGKVDKRQLWITITTTTILSILDIKSLLFIPILWIFTSWFKKSTKKIIGGMTGDTVGALCEISEAIYLIYLLIQIR